MNNCVDNYHFNNILFCLGSNEAEAVVTVLLLPHLIDQLMATVNSGDPGTLSRCPKTTPPPEGFKRKRTFQHVWRPSREEIICGFVRLIISEVFAQTGLETAI